MRLTTPITFLLLLLQGAYLDRSGVIAACSLLGQTVHCLSHPAVCRGLFTLQNAVSRDESSRLVLAFFSCAL